MLDLLWAGYGLWAGWFDVVPGWRSPDDGRPSPGHRLHRGWRLSHLAVALIIWAHIPAVIYGAQVEFAGLTCPLTLLENDLRQRAGDAGYRDGFIAHYLVRVESRHLVG
ncbi:MAG: hypothetical protein K0S98_648 [Propionibacteriaceae bacterium]|nr:hypothetical protein [Propionibacteriaceae bacterium]